MTPGASAATAGSAAVSSALAGGGGAAHPLDPLAGEEIARTAAIVRASGRLGPAAFFVRIELHEPPRDAVLAFRAGEPIDRRAFVVVRDRKARATYEAVVSLARGEITEWRGRPGSAPVGPLARSRADPIRPAARRPAAPSGRPNTPAPSERPSARHRCCY